MPRYDIGEKPAAASEEVLALLRQCETATLGHWRIWGMCNRSITPILPGRRIVGRAITVAIPGPCSVMLHHAVDHLDSGDILVVDRLGDDRYACWGGGLTLAVQAAGGAGGVVDGPCTDPQEIKDAGLPVWSRGTSPATTRQYDLGGRLNQPISVGGVVVMPGDYVLCDDSGVMVLSPKEAEAEARKALQMQKAGEGLAADLASGKTLAQMFGANVRVRNALAAES